MWFSRSAATRRSRLLIAGPSLLALSGLVTGFAVWPSDTPEPVFVKADTSPIKRSPDAPGGMEIPFQDFEIWSILEAGR
jgi:hypothetical protein